MRLQNADTCVSKQPKYRSLDGEATEYRYAIPEIDLLRWGTMNTQRGKKCLHDL